MENPGLLSKTSTVAKAVTIAQTFTAKTNKTKPKNRNQKNSIKSEWFKCPSGKKKKKNNVHKVLKK